MSRFDSSSCIVDLVEVNVEGRERGRSLGNRKKSVLVRSWAFVIVVGRDRDRLIY